MADGMEKVLVLQLPKKGNLKKCINYRTISLINHPSKILLRIILNRLKTQAEELLAEEQAGFRPKRSCVEQIFNCTVLIEKHLQHQWDLHHNFIDFKKAFDRVWHSGLWQVMEDFNITQELIRMIKALYMNAKSAVQLNDLVGAPFNTTVGVRQGCFLSPVLFNNFLERIMQETLQDHQSTITIGGRVVSNLRFADDIDLLAGSHTELQSLTDSLYRNARAFGMEVSTEKSKIMRHSVNAQQIPISMNGEILEEVDEFKYLGAILTKDGTSRKEVRARISAATAAMARLQRIWISTISTKTKISLYRSLVISILLYGCETWTLRAEDERRLNAFETKSFRKILRISYRERRTNEFVRGEINRLAGQQEPLLATIKRRKLTWFGHVNRHEGLPKTILQGTLPGSRKRGRQKKAWNDNICEWTGESLSNLTRATEDRGEWRRKSYSSSLKSPQRPRSRDD